jgi:hypothetical protein
MVPFRRKYKSGFTRFGCHNIPWAIRPSVAPSHTRLGFRCLSGQLEKLMYLDLRGRMGGTVPTEMYVWFLNPLISGDEQRRALFCHVLSLWRLP